MLKIGATQTPKSGKIIKQLIVVALHRKKGASSVDNSELQMGWVLCIKLNSDGLVDFHQRQKMLCLTVIQLYLPSPRSLRPACH